MIAFGIFDKVANSLAATTARHVFIRSRAHKTSLGQGFAGTPSSSVPASSGTAGDQKVNTIHYLMAIGCNRASQAKCGNSREKSPTAHYEIRHIFLPFDNWARLGPVDVLLITPT
jgi:hypothetical protein